MAYTLDQSHSDALAAEQFMKKITLIRDSGRIDIFLKILNWIQDVLEERLIGAMEYMYRQIKEYIDRLIRRPIPDITRNKAQKRRAAIAAAYTAAAASITPIQQKYGVGVVPGIRFEHGLIKVEPYIYMISEQIDVEIAVANSTVIPSIKISPMSVDIACQCDPENMFDPLLQSEQDNVFAKAFEVDWITDSPRVPIQLKDAADADTDTKPKRWKKDIDEIKRDVKELMAMMAAVYEFEQQ